MDGEPENGDCHLLGRGESQAGCGGSRAGCVESRAGGGGSMLAVKVPGLLWGGRGRGFHAGCGEAGGGGSMLAVKVPGLLWGVPSVHYQYNHSELTS